MISTAYITNDNAVVTSHVVSLRSPVEAYVATNIAAVDHTVSAGTLLAGVTNSLADDRQVVAMRARLARLHADLDALQEHVTLTALLDNLTRAGAALQDIGGMATETVTEDTLISYKMEEFGRRTIF